jgi:hypothetical protein
MIYIKHTVTFVLVLGLAFGFFSAFGQANQDEIIKSTSENVASVNAGTPGIVTLNMRFVYALAIDFLTMLVIFGFIYFPNYRNKEFMFTFFLFNIIIFIITFVLNKTSISMGAAFGLFAVFSMLRYRTEGISMKEMTYLLIAIALGLINAIGLDLMPILVFNAIFMAFIFVLDHPVVFKQEVSKTIVYEKIELIKPENHTVLLEDLRTRTGFDIHRFSIVSIDFLKDATTITIYYYKKR